MRLLYASQRPPYPFFLGGAARCAHRLLLSAVQDAGAQCLAVGSADYGVTRWALPPQADFEALGIRSTSPAVGGCVVDCGYPVHVLPDFMHALSDTIDEFRPDVVWSQLEGAHAVLAKARAKGVTGLLYVHDAEDDPNVLRASADLGCHMVGSSAFLARRVEAVIGRAAHVVQPASDWCFGTAGDPAGAITMINPHKVKGLDTLLEIARRLPQQRFLLQESWKLGDAALSELRQALAPLPNVRFQHRVADMRAVYAQTRLLLVPSVWEEGFGMVAVEAQSCGIPVIASARGGLPESVGDGGLLVADYHDPAAWVAAIASVLADEAAYRGWQARALAHARGADFVPQTLARRFLAVCALPPPPPAGLATRGRRLLAQGLARLPGRGRMGQGAG